MHLHATSLHRSQEFYTITELLYRKIEDFWTFLQCISSHHGHVLLAAVTEVGSAHQVQEAAIRGDQARHRLWEVR